MFRFVRVIVLVSQFVLLFGISGPAPAGAQGEHQWSTPNRIPAYNNLLTAPLLVADQNHTVYAFDLETIGPRYVIMYRSWTMAKGWSLPVDILAPDFLGLAPVLNGVFLDRNGVIHLIYFAGDADQGNIFYSRAYLAEADRTQAWSTPVPVGSGAGPVVAAALTGDGQDALFIVYGGQASGLGLYAVHSTDAGYSWSEPAVISFLDEPGFWPASVRLEMDDRARVHAVWHTITNLGRGHEIRYARLAAGSTQWTDEVVLARRDTDQELLGWPSIISSGDQLIIAYEDSFPPTKWVQNSSNGGSTWSKPVRPFPHIGGYENVVLLKDSDNTIHMILGNRLPSPEIHGMWYSRLNGHQWTPLQAIISGPSTASFDPCCPRAIISQGNVLLAVWPHNVQREFLTGAWYSYNILNAPELPVVELPISPVEVLTPTLAPTPLPVTSEPTPILEPPLATPDSSQSEASGENNPAIPIFWGVTPVIIFIGVMLAYRYTRRPSK